MNLNDLETFVLVAEEGTFTAAAQRLRVPISTVSRRVTRLETDLGVALLQRGARSIALSADGRALAAQCGPALREIGSVARNVADHRETPRGILRVTAPIDICNTSFLAALLAAYTRSFPEVEVELAVTNRYVDLLEESFDAAFRTHTGAMVDRDDLLARRLAALPVSLYASPAYLRDCGAPTSRQDLENHPLVSHTSAYRDVLTIGARIRTDDYGPVASLVAHGAGPGAIPDIVAAPHVQRGELVRLDVGFPAEPASLSIVWLRSRHLAPRVRAFIDLAVEHSAALAS